MRSCSNRPGTRSLIAVTLARHPHRLCIENAARELRVSVRTLIRRLGDGGSSFQALRDGARKDLALSLLNRPGFTVEDIARALGFSDAANFCRAFKRWFGMPPVRYRRAHSA